MKRKMLVLVELAEDDSVIVTMNDGLPEAVMGEVLASLSRAFTIRGLRPETLLRCMQTMEEGPVNPAPEPVIYHGGEG